MIFYRFYCWPLIWIVCDHWPMKTTVGGLALVVDWSSVGVDRCSWPIPGPVGTEVGDCGWVNHLVMYIATQFSLTWCHSVVLQCICLYLAESYRNGDQCHHLCPGGLKKEFTLLLISNCVINVTAIISDIVVTWNFFTYYLRNIEFTNEANPSASEIMWATAYAVVFDLKDCLNLKSFVVT